MPGQILAKKLAPLGLGLCVGLGLVILAKVVFGGDSAASAGAMTEAEAAFSNKDYATSLNLLRPLAEKGVAKAQHRLATFYAYGLGVERDNSAALNLEAQAAAHGYAKAQSGLGNIFLNGDLGIRPDDKQAMTWFQKAAEQGDADGQFHIGFMYGAGRGVPQDDDEAMTWYRKAAEQDSAYAQYALGVIYASGRGVARDDNEALAWFRRAAQNGDDNMKMAVTEIVTGIRREDAAVTQTLSNLNMYQLKLLMKTMSIMNCGQPIGTRYSMNNFVKDQVLQSTPWRNRIEIASAMATTKCGAATKPTEITLFD